MTWTVNGEPLDDGAVRAEMQRMRPRYEEEMSSMDPVEAEMQLRDWARENVIERVLLLQESRKIEDPIPDELSGQGDGAVSQFRMQRLLHKLYEEIPAPKQKDISDYHKKNREAFRRREQFHAKHVIKHVDETQTAESAYPTIQAALAELESGAEFEDVADRYSDCAGNGGDLGWFERGEMVEEFESQIRQLQPGESTGIFRTQFGFHVAKLYGHRQAGFVPLDEVRGQIADMILTMRRELALERYLDQLRAGAVISKQ